MGESGEKLDPAAFRANDNKKSVVHPDSIGMAQWNDTRALGLKQVASEMGTTWKNPKAQVAHLFNELQGSHRHVLSALKSGPDTVESGATTWTRKFEVAAPATDHLQRRINHGHTLAQTLAMPISKTISDPETTGTRGPTFTPSGIQQAGPGGGLLGFGVTGPAGTPSMNPTQMQAPDLRATQVPSRTPSAAAPYAGPDRSGLTNFDTQGVVPYAYREIRNDDGSPVFTRGEAAGITPDSRATIGDNNQTLPGGTANWSPTGGVPQGQVTTPTETTTQVAPDPLAGTTGINPVGSFGIGGILGTGESPDTEIVGTDPAPAETTAPAPVSTVPTPPVNTPDPSTTGPQATSQTGPGAAGKPNSMSALRQGLEGLTKVAAGLAMKGPLHYAPPEQRRLACQ